MLHLRVQNQNKTKNLLGQFMAVGRFNSQNTADRHNLRESLQHYVQTENEHELKVFRFCYAWLLLAQLQKKFLWKRCVEYCNYIFAFGIDLPYVEADKQYNQEISRSTLLNYKWVVVSTNTLERLHQHTNT